MIIVFVEDNYAHETDGTAVSAHRFRDELIKRGHTVRVLAIGVQGTDMYSLKEHYVPLVTEVASKNNMRFGKFDKKIVTEAFTGADMVHLFFPWQLERKCLKLAREMGIPVSAAFHCQPENVSYNMMMKLLEPLNVLLYFLFRTWLYRNVDNIHCPSSFIAGELRRHKYYARFHTFSNGVSDFFKPPASPPEKTGDVINVMMIGRLAEEKRQDLIIRAVKHSKYRDRIRLFFAGRGPMLKRYQRQSADLPIPPRFEFLSPDKLLEQIYQTDVYIHASDAEIEGISCIESIACGKVPIISDSKKSASSQFALDERSLFKKGNYLDLRDKLDYWIEHPEERERMSREYAKVGELYNISHSVKKMEKMFEDAVRDSKTRRLIQEDKKIRKYYRLTARNNVIKEFFCRVFYFGIAMPILILVNKIFFGLKIENKKVLRKIKKSGAVCICNHIHQMDCTMCAVGIPRRKLTFVSLPSNFSMPVAGLFVDVLGSVPIPSSPREMQVFIYSLSRHLRKRHLILFYPEGERQNYNENLREFQRGAFYVAIDAQVPVLPIKIVLRKPDGLLKFFRKKPCFTLVFGEPLYPQYFLLKNDAVEDLKKRSEEMMCSLGAVLPPPPPPLT
ncbi:MAG: glycosyltransferase [Treponema sp.]|jgi:1-acyl-sn-glycerol-3-phosphate acyltransferase|nr:glycosyltransferase [Treponema sp.]